MHYMLMQQQLIEAQREIIELRERIDDMTPETPADDEIWHIKSGMMSSDAAESDDLETVEEFQKWNIEFARKHIKPYVNPKTYGEALNQMTRGLPQRVALLRCEEKDAERKGIKKEGNKKIRAVSPQQMRLIH